MTMRIWPGRPYPLGATWDGAGVNFAIFSENATGVELCLFREPDDAEESAKIRVHETSLGLCSTAPATAAAPLERMSRLSSGRGADPPNPEIKAGLLGGACS